MPADAVTEPEILAILKPMIKHYVTGIIDSVIESGEADLAIVAGVPAMVVIDWLGLDPAEYQTYVDAMHTLVSAAPDSAEYRHAADVAVPWVENWAGAHGREDRWHAEGPRSWWIGGLRVGCGGRI